MAKIYCKYLYFNYTREDEGDSVLHRQAERVVDKGSSAGLCLARWTLAEGGVDVMD
jgi:hypothetical protein